MRTLAVLMLGMVTLFALGYFVYRQYPRTQIVTYTVCKAVPEDRVHTVTKSVVVKGETVDVTVDIPYRVAKPVAEERVQEISPSLFQKLQFILLTGIAVIFGIYMLVLIATLARDKWTRRRENADTRDTQKRVDGLVTFCTGVLVGFLGNSDVGRLQLSATEPSDPYEYGLQSIDNIPVDGGYLESETTLFDPMSRSGEVGDPNTPKFEPRPVPTTDLNPPPN